MKTLMVTQYAPYRDGIAAYAVQEVKARRAAGEDVEVLSPLPSAAHYHVPLGDARGMAALVRRVSQFDQVILQFSPDLVFGGTRTAAGRRAVWAGLAALVKRKPTEIRIHEIEYELLAQDPQQRRFARFVMQRAAQLTVHTEGERDQLAHVLDLDLDRFEIVDHGRFFQARSGLDRETARAALGLPDGFVFLSIGFLQSHKGFDRGIRAFAKADVANAALYVVGDTRKEEPETAPYAFDLEVLAEATPGAHMVRRFVGDAEFDEWIIASDCLVLPYRKIWSSGVIERAKLLERPVIATDVGGLSQQYGHGVTLVHDDDGLVRAMEDVVGQHSSRVTGQ